MFNIKQLFLIIILVSLSTASLANDVNKFAFITNNYTTQDNSPYQIDLNLSSEVQAAINSGVAISIISDYASTKHFIFWHHYKKIQSIKFQLRRHAISNRYMVMHPEQKNLKVFRSITEAMQYISSSSLHILQSLQQETDKIALRIHLNKFDLPGSLRPKAFLSSDWTHNTGWKIWKKSI